MKKLQFRKTHFLVVSNTVVTHLGRCVSLGDTAMAITLWPFIFIRPSCIDNKALINHEEIHIRQQIELFVIGAYLLYSVEYLYARYIKKYLKRDSYYYTSTEQEAYRNAFDERYLETRTLFSTFKYLFNKIHIE